jgi:hypothetical protein
MKKMIVAGRIMTFLILVVGMALSLYGQWVGKNNPKQIVLRRVPGIDAIEEMVGRAAEMGRPALFTGWKSGAVYSATDNSNILAGMVLLRYLAGHCARKDVPLYTASGSQDVTVISNRIILETYKEEGKEHLYDPANTLWFPEQSYSSGLINKLEDLRPAACLYVGAIFLEAVIISTTGRDIGAMQVAAVSRGNFGFFFPNADYTFLGEELFAATAQLSEDPVQLGSIYGIDFLKLIFLVVLILGSILTNIGSPIIGNILRI